MQRRSDIPDLIRSQMYGKTLIVDHATKHLIFEDHVKQPQQVTNPQGLGGPRKQIVKAKAKTVRPPTDEVSIEIQTLARQLREALKNLRPLSDSICIFRVPKILRHLNEKAYIPQIIAIGPLHCGQEKLLPMAEVKGRYLQNFLDRSEVSIEELYIETHQSEVRLRDSYAETIQLSTHDFLNMSLIDGVFIIEYLLKRHFKDWESYDPVFNKERLTNTIRFDLLLLENQLPFFFLEQLLRLSKKLELCTLSIIELLHQFLKESTGWDSLPEENNIEIQQADVRHILHFLGICLLPLKPRAGAELKLRASPTIAELHSAGVKFQSTPNRHFLDIQFTNGVLDIPAWKINDSIEILFRNLLAFEQCNPPNRYLSDYVAFMAMLINVEEDVDILVQNGIIESLLQDNHSVATLVNNLSKHNFIYDKDFYFTGLIQGLKNYCERPWHKWKATLKREYFKNPWTIISVIAATFLILLTVLQSVCSVLQVV